MMDTTLHILGSQTGEKARKAWTKKGRKEIYSKQAMTHESGHLLHGFTNPNMYKIGTMSQMNYIADATDPLDVEKAQLSRINTDIMMELNQRPYTAEWNYAKDPMQANPAEVVAEVFTALMNRRRNIPRGLAAVYLAYGGMRSPQIDALLTHIFGGNIPTLSQPQYAIPLIQND
jgi:hypothetical protein